MLSWTCRKIVSNEQLENGVQRDERMTEKKTTNFTFVFEHVLIKKKWQNFQDLTQTLIQTTTNKKKIINW